jgi:hypothetical protein
VGFTEFLGEFGGLPVVGFPPEPGAAVPPAGRTPADVAWRLDVRNGERPSEPYVFEDVFDPFLAMVDTSRVTALVVGQWADPPHAEHHPARLRQAWPGVDIDLSDHQREGDRGRYVAVGA